MSLHEKFTSDIERRVPFVAIAIVCVVGIVLWRLFDLQVLQGSTYQESAAGHGVRRARIPAARGHMESADGVVLARNERVRQLVAIPAQVTQPERMLDAVARVTAVPRAQLAQRYERAAQQSSQSPVVLIPDAQLDQLSPVLAWQSPWQEGLPYDFRGLRVDTVYSRRYAHDVPAGHLLGYLREINQDELLFKRRMEPGRYVAGNLVGANGLESAWQAQLRGHDGLTAYLVDALGREVQREGSGQFERRAPQRGDTLHLSLHAGLQRSAYDALGEHRGAIVALDPRSGKILAMVSKPDYDVNRLMGPERSAYWTALREDPARPLINRALRGAYPPGSTYKIVVAAAAIAEQVVTPNERVTCTGGRKFGGRRFGCWNRAGHGSVTLRQAMEQSCDVFFYELGQRLGVDRIAEYAKRFGFGQATGIDLPHERTGLVPTKAWKKKVRKKNWLAGETLSVAIGQGYNLATPLQVATMTAIVANDGQEVFPHFVKSQHPHATEPRQVIDAAIVQEIEQGLIDVVEGPRATAKSLQALNLKIAGKTGTAQVVGLLRAKGIRSHNDHAWFSAYAPYDDPQIAVAVFVEHGGSGGKVAAPIAGKVIQAYLQPTTATHRNTDTSTQ